MFINGSGAFPGPIQWSVWRQPTGTPSWFTVTECAPTAMDGPVPEKEGGILEQSSSISIMKAWRVAGPSR